ncbi:tumor necrosis factor receptor superfamily member 5-like [Chaetodon auriga]|uniref:tumor necrosis factor receptor superfamily member 5-like n=1 Tax=Chaetodon auriga TaxID=39042 RepID=UPI004032E0E0
MKTVIQQYKMMFGGKSVTAAPLLILVMNIFIGLTLTCHRSEYQIRNECCPMCLAGSRVETDCTEYRNTSCLPCSEGTFMNRPNGRGQCFSCTSCDAGSGFKIKTSCTTTSDTVCEPLEGFYCLERTEDVCMTAQKHTRCQPGQYILQKGTALTDTVCSDCTNGTYSDGTFPSCQPHTQCESVNLQLIQPGTVSTDAECGEQRQDWTIPAIIVGVVLVLFLVTAALVLCYFKRKKKNPNRDTRENGVNIELEKMPYTQPHRCLDTAELTVGSGQKLDLICYKSEQRTDTQCLELNMMEQMVVFTKNKEVEQCPLSMDKLGWV